MAPERPDAAAGRVVVSPDDPTVPSDVPAPVAAPTTPDVARLREGHRIGPYRISRKLGAGGMGVVYLARDTRLQRQVALKCVGPRYQDQPNVRRDMLREARAGAWLSHPNIATIHDVLDYRGQVVIVMEFVEGESLRARMTTGRLPLEESLRIGLDLARAVEAAHAKGILHCDLKPANVFFTPSGVVKVLDFGLAQAVPGRPELLTGVVVDRDRLMGTPGYIAPERYLGEPPDERSDVYSLGVMLFEMLNGHKPFHRIEDSTQALKDPRRSMTDTLVFQPHVPAPVADAVARAMAARPNERFATASALRQALEAAVPPPAPLTVTRWGPVSALAALCLVLLTALGITAAARSVGPPAGPRVLAMLPFTYAGQEKDGSILAAGLSGEILTDRLSSLPGFTIVRPTIQEVGTPAEPPTELARDLGATHVATGTLREGADGALRAEVELRATKDGAQLWRETYEGTRAELPALHERVARGYINALRRVDQSAGAVSDAARQRLSRPATASVDALADYSQAQRFLERQDIPGNLDHAITLYQSAMRKDPRFVYAHAGLGSAYWQHFLITKDPAWVHKAREAALNAVRLDANSPAVRLLVANIDKGTGNPDKAIAELQNAITLDAEYDEAYRQLGLLYAERGRRAEAEAALKHALRLRPDYWEHHRMLGRAYIQMGRYADAVKAFTRATELQPDSGWAHQNLGAAYQFLGDDRRALESYQRANALAPRGSTYFNIGEIHYDDGRFAEALRAFEQGMFLAPRDASFPRRAADAHRRLGSRREAIALYAKASAICTERLETNPADSESLGDCALSQAYLGHHARARAFAERGVRANPESHHSWYVKAEVASVAGELAEAERALKVAIEKGASVAEVKRDEDLGAVRNRVFGTSKPN
jgi:eukaryotic-like serine/threonine-protein kinase